MARSRASFSTLHVEYFGRVHEKRHEPRIILPGGKGILPDPATVHDIIPCIWEFYPEWSRHNLNVYQINTDKLIKDLTYALIKSGAGLDPEKEV